MQGRGRSSVQGRLQRGYFSAVLSWLPDLDFSLSVEAGELIFTTDFGPYSHDHLRSLR